MALISKDQLDMFEEQSFPEFITIQKIMKLEEQQNNLRRGMFKRWNEQEKKIETLSSHLNQLVGILSSFDKEENHE